MAYSSAELKFIEENRSLIESRATREIMSNLWYRQDGNSFLRSQGEVSARRMAFKIMYILCGPEKFRLRWEDRGPSRSKGRADRGQRIMRFWLEVEFYPGTFFQLTYLKWTSYPDRVEWDILEKPLAGTVLNLTHRQFPDVIKHCKEEWAKTGGKY